MVDTPQAVDHRALLAIADRRDQLCRRPPTCPACGTVQVQLMTFSPTTAAWRCRMCRPKHRWETTDSPPSAIDTIDKVLREHLGSLEATTAAVSVYLALRRVGLLVDPPDSPGP